MQTRNDLYKPRKGDRKTGDPGGLLIIFYIGLVVMFLLLGTISRSAAAEREDQSAESEKITLAEIQQGELLVATGEPGSYTKTPLLSQKIDVAISGMVVRAKVRQVFHNTGDAWVEAVYVFPLPPESGVTHMQMRIGERTITGVVKEKEAARETYLKARAEGRKTSLLAQKRPNIFTMAVANIGPGEKITVEMELNDTVRYADGIFSYRFPLVVGPRYIPGIPDKVDRQKVSFDAGGWASGTDQVSDAAQITPPVRRPDEPPANGVALQLFLQPGFPIKGLSSLYHGAKVDELADNAYQLHLDGRVFADRDFVVEYQPANDYEISASLFSESFEKEHYSYLMLMPPQKQKNVAIPREVIFVLDISGSMAGSSIRQARQALQLAVSRLSARDRFNIIIFHSEATSLFPSPLAGTEENKGRAARKIARIEAHGGTEMASALRLALGAVTGSRPIRQVVFLTDGAVGNERELFQLITRTLGNSRLFTVGIGSAPNSFFMRRAAAMGRGSFVYIGKVEEVRSKMDSLFRMLENPVVTDVQLVATDGRHLEIHPDPLPDLYAGEPVVCLFKTSSPPEELQVAGVSNGAPWSISLPGQKSKMAEGVATLWGRKKIVSLMDTLSLGASEESVRNDVVQVALRHSLVSRYTSLVAVEEKISRSASDDLQRERIKNNLPDGWQYNKVFGTSVKTATRAELAVTAGLLLAAAAVILLITSIRRRVWRTRA